MSPTRCVAALVWPLAWQSKQATPRLGLLGAPVLGLVELLLGERRDQQPQALELLRVQDAVEELEEVVDRDELALGDVAQVGARGEEDRRRELGQEVVRQVEVEIEAGRGRARSCRLTSSMWNFGKTIPPSGWFGCGSGRKPAGNSVAARGSRSGVSAASASQVMPAGA